MAVYRVALSAPEDLYRQLVRDPASFGLPGEVESAASVTGFHLHLFWPRRNALHLIVDGDDTPGGLGDLLAERLGEGWVPRWERVPAAENAPSSLQAGQLSAWTVRMALGPDDEVCDICGSVLPDHSAGCACNQSDDGRVTRTRQVPEHGGSGSELEPNGGLVETADEAEAQAEAVEAEPVEV